MDHCIGPHLSKYLIIDHEHLIIDHEHLIIDHEHSIIDHEHSIIDHEHSIIDHEHSIIIITIYCNEDFKKIQLLIMKIQLKIKM